MSASGFDNPRIEQEEKLFVPPDMADEVWNFLHQRYVVDTERLHQLDPLFTSYYNEEQFADVYYDTPSLQLYAMKSGVRHRRRLNLTDPTNAKSGRELMQIKLNNISSNALERGEIKYAIEYPTKWSDAEDHHPMLGIVKRSHRQPFKARLEALGLDPYSMRPILTVHDRRTRIYIKRDGQPFMSISLDRVHSNIWWAKATFVEIEPELGEIVFTDADPATRKYMESILAQVVTEIREKFPYIQSNLTPKYNKSFDQMWAQLPFLKLLVRANLLTTQAMWMTLLAAALGAAALYWFLRRLRLAPLLVPRLRTGQ